MESPFPESNPLRKIPTRFVAPTTADIGSTLREARHRRGQTLEAASLNTRIPKKFLEAMEANRLEELPAMAYLRGFLKNYCDYLDIDFEPLWKNISAAAEPAPAGGAGGGVMGDTTQVVSPDSGPPGAGPSAGKGGDTASAASSMTPPQAKVESPPHAPSGPPAFVVLGLIGAMAAGGILWIATSGSEPPQKPAPSAPPEVLQPLTASREAVLVVEFKDDAWIRIQADGQLRFEGRVPKGSRQEWRSRQGFDLRVPAPESLSLSLNGSDYSLKSPDPAGNYRIDAP